MTLNNKNPREYFTCCFYVNCSDCEGVEDRCKLNQYTYDDFHPADLESYRSQMHQDDNTCKYHITLEEYMKMRDSENEL